MQFSQKTFASQNAIKQLYRQYSTTFKNNDTDKNKIMTQSSNLPFNKIYNAFNSTGNVKNFAFDYKNSEAKSIIEKLMQTKQVPHNIGQQQLLLMNQIPNFQINQSKQPIPLNQTQTKIFCQIVNLITQIKQINQKSGLQNQEFLKFKEELRKQGVEFPEVDQKKSTVTQKMFQRFTKEELEAMFEQNQGLQKQIEKLTKDLINKNDQQSDESILKHLQNDNKGLKKQIASVKSQIYNTGQVDQDQINDLTIKINQLQNEINLLQQKRMGKFTQRDSQWRMLKSQNQKLRLRTIELLRTTPPVQRNQRKQDLIRILKIEQQNKSHYVEQMSVLKSKYSSLMHQNSELKRHQSSQKGGGYYDGPLQVQSKVSPFHNIYGQYRSSYGMSKESNTLGKQNYLQNYEPQKMRGALNQYNGNGKYSREYEVSRRKKSGSLSKYELNMYETGKRRERGDENGKISQYEEFAKKFKDYYQ